MSKPLEPPRKKDPQKRSVVPTLPPLGRSRAALGLTVAAADGRFALQHCAECGAVQYPPRDACANCLSGTLVWRDTETGGKLIAETRIHASPDPYFRERLPWRMGTVKLDAGPVALVHLHGDVARGDRVRLSLHLDKASQGVIVALPTERTDAMEDDPLMRSLTANPRYRRILVTDARAPVTLPLIHALQKAGASHVFVGEAEVLAALARPRRHRRAGQHLDHAARRYRHRQPAEPGRRDRRQDRYPDQTRRVSYARAA